MGATMPEWEVQRPQPPTDQLPDGAVTQRLHGCLGGYPEFTPWTGRPRLLHVPQDGVTDRPHQRIHLRVGSRFRAADEEAFVFPIEIV